MAEIDFNIDNYTKDDLINLFSLKNTILSKQLILDITNEYITKSESEMSLNMANFFKDAQIKLLDYLDSEDDNSISSSDDSSSDEDDDEIDNGEYSKNLITNIDYDPENDTEFANFVQPAHLEPKNQEQKEKITDRIEHTEVLGIDKHFVQKRRNLGVSDVMQVPITQGILNPNLTNKISRIINVDSQYRQNISMTTSGNPCDFTIDLSEPINDIIHMRLFSLQVPYTWWLIDEAYGTNFFLLDDTKITIDEGNYTLPELINEINSKLPEDVSANLHLRNGKTTFNIKGYKKITFYNKSYLFRL